jgi:hypothetical protein
MFFDKLNRLFEVINACCLSTIMGGGYKVLNSSLMLLQEGVDVGLVKNLCALCLR